MKIAILGWGSLVWNPGKLNINSQNTWSTDGPELPIEFARISNDGRLTLVIKDKCEKIKTLYSISNYEKREEAILDLAVREGCGRNKIGYYDKTSKKIFPDKFQWKDEIEKWIENNKEIDAVIWTNLKANFKDATDLNFEPDNIVNYLKYLKAETQALAEEYIRKTPSQIKTTMRKIIEEKLGWTPIIKS